MRPNTLCGCGRSQPPDKPNTPNQTNQPTKQSTTTKPRMKLDCWGAWCGTQQEQVAIRKLLKATGRKHPDQPLPSTNTRQTQSHQEKSKTLPPETPEKWNTSGQTPAVGQPPNQGGSTDLGESWPRRKRAIPLKNWRSKNDHPQEPT